MSNDELKLWKTLKVIRTKRINGVPYKRINIYHPVTFGMVVLAFLKALPRYCKYGSMFFHIKRDLKDISKEFEWKRDYLQEYEDRNNGTNIDK